MAVREARQTLEARVPEHLVLAPHHRARGRPRQLPEDLVHLGQQPHVRRRAAPLEGPRRRTAAAILDPPRVRVLRDQPRDLRPRQPRRVRQVPPQQTLVGSAQPPVLEARQRPPRELVRRLAIRPREVHRRAAGNEQPHLLQGREPFRFHLQDHPPMIPIQPPPGSSLVGLTLPLQAHLSLDKTLLCPTLATGIWCGDEATQAACRRSDLS